ncbi:MAG: LysR family transcriptional regulator [Alphaproteobacteria bacterium]|nr:LysR family transcriptional regulator [Alphaproteobacteria bacterium]
MTLDQLRTFVAVAQRGSFTRAARALDCAQSTVSFHVAALEASLGTHLLERGGRGVRLTQAGARLLPRARAMLALSEEARQDIADEPLRGPVVIEASTIPASCLLPDALTRLRAEAPALRVVVRVSDSSRALRALVEGACDVAVVGAAPGDARILSRAIGEDRIVLVGRPDAKPPASLQGQPLVLREPGSGTREAVEHLTPADGPWVEVGSTDAARRCVLAGLGFAMISEWAVRDDLDAGRLRVFPLEGTPVPRSFYLARLRGVTPSPLARWVWGALAETPADVTGPVEPVASQRPAPPG